METKLFDTIHSYVTVNVLQQE